MPTTHVLLLLTITSLILTLLLQRPLIIFAKSFLRRHQGPVDFLEGRQRWPIKAAEV